VPLRIIADNCGTSIRMIEKNYAKVLARHKLAHLERFAPTVLKQDITPALPLLEASAPDAEFPASK
jgi:hypothetical protein